MSEINRLKAEIVCWIFVYHAARVTRNSCSAIGNPRLVQVVLRHLDIDPVADGNADEILAHLAGEVREDLVAIGQFNAEHGAGQHLRDGSGQFDVLFSRHGERQFKSDILPIRPKKSIFSRMKNAVDIPG
jgi:hypothetical protein